LAESLVRIKAQRTVSSKEKHPKLAYFNYAIDKVKEDEEMLEDEANGKCT